MYDRRTVLRVSGVAVTGGLAGCGSPSEETSAGAATDPDNLVEMTDQERFEPRQITVESGATVTWETTGTEPHSVTAYEDQLPDGADYFASGGFDSESAAQDNYPGEGAIDVGETYENTFETTGEFAYFCIPHEGLGMTGTVVVE